MKTNIVNKALSIATGGTLTGYLPDPLVNDLINIIREVNVMRNLVPTFNMNGRTQKKPKKVGALAAYHVPDGVTATLSSFGSTQVEWVAKKLMSFCQIDEEAIEDSVVNVVDQILADFAEALAEAEELALCCGNPSHLATAPTPESATDANWFVYDPRLLFKGIWAYAADSTACTPVDALTAAMTPDLVNRAVYNMGKYGRVKSALIGFLPSLQAAAIRQDQYLKNAAYSGQASTIHNGLPGAGNGNGFVANIYGVPFFEVPSSASDVQVVIQHRNAFAMGDRRAIKFKNTEVIESDVRKYVVSERIAFNYSRPEAMVAINNLKATLTTEVEDS